MLSTIFKPQDQNSLTNWPSISEIFFCGKEWEGRFTFVNIFRTRDTSGSKGLDTQFAMSFNSSFASNELTFFFCNNNKPFLFWHRQYFRPCSLNTEDKTSPSTSPFQRFDIIRLLLWIDSASHVSHLHFM